MFLSFKLVFEVQKVPFWAPFGNFSSSIPPSPSCSPKFFPHSQRQKSLFPSTPVLFYPPPAANPRALLVCSLPLGQSRTHGAGYWSYLQEAPLEGRGPDPDLHHLVAVAVGLRRRRGRHARHEPRAPVPIGRMEPEDEWNTFVLLHFVWFWGIKLEEAYYSIIPEEGVITFW